jgi:hypothetical protein
MVFFSKRLNMDIENLEKIMKCAIKMLDEIKSEMFYPIES